MELNRNKRQRKQMEEESYQDPLKNGPNLATICMDFIGQRDDGI